VAEAGPGLPSPAEVLTGCLGFLVDDDFDRPLGVVDDVVKEQSTLTLLVSQGWGGRRIAIPMADVVEISPQWRRLVVRSRAGHPWPECQPSGRSSGMMRVALSLRRWIEGRRGAVRARSARV
jgi:hypothetical protein